MPAITDATPTELEGQTDLADDDFDAGFDGATPTATPAPTEQQTAAVKDAAAPAAAPKYVQITQQQLDNLMSSAARIDEIKATQTTGLDKAFGKIGGIERLVQQLQTSTPSGEPVALSPEDFAELAEEYPDLAELQMKGLNRVMAKLNVRGTGEGLDPAKVEQMVTQRLEPALQQVESRVEQLVQSTLLGRDHKDWREVVGAPDAKNEFRTWLATQPAAYQAELNSTIDAQVISAGLTKFKASKKTTSISQRQSRLDAAATERGAGGFTEARSDDDDFNAGFKSG